MYLRSFGVVVSSFLKSDAPGCWLLNCAKDILTVCHRWVMSFTHIFSLTGYATSLSWMCGFLSSYHNCLTVSDLQINSTSCHLCASTSVWPLETALSLTVKRTAARNSPICKSEVQPVKKIVFNIFVRSLKHTGILSLESQNETLSQVCFVFIEQSVAIKQLTRHYAVTLAVQFSAYPRVQPFALMDSTTKTTTSSLCGNGRWWRNAHRNIDNQTLLTLPHLTSV